MSSCGPTGRRFNDSPLPSPIVAVTSKKSHTKFGSLMLYRILHWLPVLHGSLTIVPSTIRIARLVASSSRHATFSRRGDIRNVTMLDYARYVGIEVARRPRRRLEWGTAQIGR